MATIDFLGLRYGWVVVSRENSLQVDRTADEGSAWQSVSLPASLFPSGWNSAEVSFIDGSDGWVLVQPYAPTGSGSDPLCSPQPTAAPTGRWQIAMLR
jgi:hypothetical protein